jgi:hypothetical protein
MGFYVSEEFNGFTLFYEENNVGGIWIWLFLGFWSGFHVGLLRRGDAFVFYVCIWGNFGVLSCDVNGVT